MSEDRGRVAVARFMKVCLDATEPSRLGPFWAQILDLAWEPDREGEGGLCAAATRQPTIWFNLVPESQVCRPWRSGRLNLGEGLASQAQANLSLAGQAARG